MSKKYGIPERWEHYRPFGDVIVGTRFVAFKVPLKESLCKKLPEFMVFTPSNLINSVHKLGMVIDLTNTNRYYNSTEITSFGILYNKIFCPGRVVPKNEVVKKFFNVIDDFLQNNENDFIGVHCTHGVNRTGYLICRYMIEKLKYTAKDAIYEFNKARGHHIEREEYIENLYALINDNIGNDIKGDQLLKREESKDFKENRSFYKQTNQDAQQDNVVKYKNNKTNRFNWNGIHHEENHEKNKRDYYCRSNSQQNAWLLRRDGYDSNYRNDFKINKFKNFSYQFSNNGNFTYKRNFNRNNFQNSSFHYRRSFDDSSFYSRDGRPTFENQQDTNFNHFKSLDSIYCKNKSTKNYYCN